MIGNFIGQRVINHCGNFTHVAPHIQPGFFDYGSSRENIPTDQPDNIHAAFIRHYELVENVLKSQSLFVALLIGSLAIPLFLLFGTAVSTPVLALGISTCLVSWMFAVRKISRNAELFSTLIRIISTEYQTFAQLNLHSDLQQGKDMVVNKFKKIETFKNFATNNDYQQAVAKLSAIKV